MAHRRIFTVLRSGGEYEPRHVQWLKDQCTVHAPGVDFICLTDHETIPGVNTIPLKHGWPGWWSKIELFVHDHVLYLDLDTVLIGNISDMVADEFDGFMALTNFGGFKRKGRVVMGSGIMSWQRCPRQVYDNFSVESIHQYSRHQNRWGDQGYILDQVGQFTSIQDRYPNRIHSYKFSGIDQDDPCGDIICFHGKPRPWECDKIWIPRFTNRS